MTPVTIRTGLDQSLLEDAFRIRRQVFVHEQEVPEALEFDGLDDDAWQFIAEIVDGTPVGTARLRILDDAVGKPERVAVLPEYRGQGIGEQLMETVHDQAEELGCTRLLLHAQVTVEEFYRGLGYRTVSEPFDEAGIAHVKMELDLTAR